MQKRKYAAILILSSLIISFVPLNACRAEEAETAVPGSSSGSEHAEEPAPAPTLTTRWSKDVSMDAPLPEYPRPQMTRPEWMNLNGAWQCAIVPRGEGRPADFPDTIVVPFPVESALSGVRKTVGPDHRLWYRRTFFVRDAWREQRLLLHFGAVDWDATVWVNGREAGRHVGGYDPFTLDVTDLLTPEAGQELVVAAWDPSDAGDQPRGKQVRKPHGIWYTPTTGIWRTVWFEPVPRASIARLEMTPELDASILRLRVEGRGAPEGAKVKAVVVEGVRIIAEVAGSVGRAMDILIDSPKPWSPDSPFLYDLQVMLFDNEKVIDEVSSYFGMRKIALDKDVNGTMRLFLNNEPLFQFGLLDQGFWPDGLYTAPTDEARRYDIEITRELGFNMARKHVKIEPDRWYYWCDRLGLLVWQDMPSGDRFIGGNDPDILRDPVSAKQYDLELKRMIDACYNHPCIVMWVPFNEGWGQFDTARVARWIKNHDPSRLVDSVSGWADRGVGDVHDIHSYPGPAAPALEENRAVVLGEFGGLGLPLSGHTWQDEKNWGYRSFETIEALNEAYEKLLKRLKLLATMGLAAAVYTQTTDVEIEVNGVMTYDRAKIKLDPERAKTAAVPLYDPPMRIRVLVPSAEEARRSGTESAEEPKPAAGASPWHYTLEEPGKAWQRPGFDDSDWQEGRAGFGRKGTPGAIVHTPWTTSDIWLRKRFVLDEGDLSNPHLWIHHDEEAEVYVNGVLAARMEGYTTGYTLIPLFPDAVKALVKGENTMAIHCHQTGGGQYIDSGLIELTR